MRILFDIALLLSLFSTGLSLKTVFSSNGDEGKFALRAGARRIDEDCDSIMDIICKLKNTSTFCELMNEALLQNIELGLRLGMGRPFTVFAPTNDAFEEWEDQFLRLTSEQKNRTLLFHFNEDVIKTYEDMECQSKLLSVTGDTSRVKCRRKSPGEYVKFQRGNGNKELDNFPLIDIKNKPACSGIIHRIDHVLLPAVFSPFEELRVDEDPEDSVPTPIPTSAVFPIENPTEAPSDKESTALPTKEPATPPTLYPTFPPTEDSEDPDIEDPTLAPTPKDSVEDGVKQPTAATITMPPRAQTPAPTAKDSAAPSSIASPDPTESITEEEPKRKFRINALGINLIMFSTLLLCFVFVCMRR